MNYHLENEDAATIAADVPDYLRGYISEPAYAHIRRTSVRTCQRDRQLRKSPPFVRLGRRVFYRIEAIQTWLVSNEQGQTQPERSPNSGRTRLVVMEAVHDPGYRLFDYGPLPATQADELRVKASRQIRTPHGHDDPMRSSTLDATSLSPNKRYPTAVLPWVKS